VSVSRARLQLGEAADRPQHREAGRRPGLGGQPDVVERAERREQIGDLEGPREPQRRPAVLGHGSDVGAEQRDAARAHR
jgi:hypothetical protein